MTTLTDLAHIAAPLNDELTAQREAIARAVAGKTMAEAQAIINVMMPQIRANMERVAQVANTATRIMADWVRGLAPMPVMRLSRREATMYFYARGTPHQRHRAWRKLKRAGIHLPNPAR